MASNFGRKRSADGALLSSNSGSTKKVNVEIHEDNDADIPTRCIFPPERPRSLQSTMSFDSGQHQHVEIEERRYRHVEVREREFRLLRVLPGTGDDPIDCSLSVHDIDAVPCYEAILYRWGDNRISRDILLCHEDQTGARGTLQNFSIPLQVYDFLRTIRLENRSTVLFIDPVCIDQTNVPEKTSQIRLMSEVYKKAERVLAWLGAGTAATD